MSSFPTRITYPARRKRAAQYLPAARTIAERWLMWRAMAAFVRANLRYWPSVAPRVGVALDRWEQAARSIPNPALRAMALDKLSEEHLNARNSATLATLAPRKHRGTVTTAIVALQVMYDYLDVLGERPGSDIADAERLFGAFIDSLERSPQPEASYYRDHTGSEDGGYLRALRDTVAAAVGRLPAGEAIRPLALAAARRCVEAQILNHAACASGTEDLERWAIDGASATNLEWQEFLGGASASVLAIHALLAAAAREETTPAQAALVDSLYMRIGAVSMLDSLVDLESDRHTGQLGYLDHYGGEHGRLAASLRRVIRDVLNHARLTPDGPHHVMTLAGVVAHYSSAICDREDPAYPTMRLLGRELGPLIFPVLALMKVRRTAERLRRPHRCSGRG
jgi:tetraprenyl-beta-curcumene synthase